MIKKKLPHALPVEEIEKRCQEKIPDIKIDKQTYISTKIKCRFYHNCFGEWWTRPKDIIRGKSKRPKSISLTEFKSKISKDFKWKLDDSTFVDIKTKARFTNGGNEWWVQPELVINKKSYSDPFEKWDSYELEKEIQINQPYISINHSTYKCIGEKCTLIDSEFGSWEATPISVLVGGKHSKRAGNQPLTALEIKNRLVNKPYMFLDESSFVSTNSIARFIDIEYGEFFAKPKDVLIGKNHKKRCKRGLELLFSSLMNIDIYNKKPEFLKEYNKIIRTDFKLSDNIYVETDGIYWHSEKRKNNIYHHFNRRELFEKHGKTLLQLREYEIVEKPEVVKSICNNLLGNNKEILAEDCQIIENIDSTFFTLNCLSRDIVQNSVGLLYNDKVVCGINYSISDSLNIHAFCNLVDTNVVNGLKILISFLEKKYLKDIMYTIDLRYEFDQDLYNVGFTLQETYLDWCWTNSHVIYDKLRELNDWYKIYDAGKAKYKKHLKH